MNEEVVLDFIGLSKQLNKESNKNDIEVVRCGDCSNREGCRIYDNSHFNSNSYCEYGSK